MISLAKATERLSICVGRRSGSPQQHIASDADLTVFAVAHSCRGAQLRVGLVRGAARD